MPIDILFGHAGLREGIGAGRTVADILRGVEEECAAFSAEAQPQLLY